MTITAHALSAITVNDYGLIMEPIDITFRVPISNKQFDALERANAGPGALNSIAGSIPLQHMRDENGPMLKLLIPAHRLDDGGMARIAAAIWTYLDFYVAAHEKDA